MLVVRGAHLVHPGHLIICRCHLLTLLPSLLHMDTFGFGGVLPEVRHRNLQHSDVVLDGTNYIPWKLTVKRIFDGLRVFSHVDDSSTAPVPPYLSDSPSSSLEAADGSTSLSPAILDSFEKKLEKWVADDSTVKMVVCQTVTLEVRSEIADLSTAQIGRAHV